MILYINYFSDENEARKQEYLYCLSRNQSLDFIEKIYVFLENSSDKNDITETQKIEFVDLGRRLEFKDVFDHVSLHHGHGQVFCILNLDIFLDDSEDWRLVDERFFLRGHSKKSMVLKRIDILDYSGKLAIASRSWLSGKFCDGWLFKTPLDQGFLLEDFQFCVGNAPYCDNLMMFLMSKHYHTFSWGKKYQSFHFDICRKVGQASAMILNSKTDVRPQARVGQHAMISAEQDWDYLLANQIPPEVRMKG